MRATGLYSRRDFLARVSLAASSIGLLGAVSSRGALPLSTPPVGVFSKIYQELKLNFEQTAAVTADAGLEGIDCPVRPGGQILPENAADQLPRLAEALARRNCRVLLLTTGILNVRSPHAEEVLRSAQRLGVKHYRLGYWRYRPDVPKEAQLERIRTGLTELAALNRELGMCALLQNHAGANMVGAKVRDLYEIARSFAPSEIGIAFDIGHALHELPSTWKAEFERLRSHFAVAYLKDWKSGVGFVPMGEGEIGGTDFLKLVKATGRVAPFSMHIEYDWASKAGQHTAAALAKALRQDAEVLRRWWAAA